MFNAVIFHAAADRAGLLRALVAETGQLLVMREFTSLPRDYELARLLNTLAPDVVILDMAMGTASVECAAKIREFSPETPIIGYGATTDLLALARQVGFNSIVSPRATSEDLRNALQEALRQQEGLEKSLYSFLPSKAGSGASTVVLNTAVALARDTNQRVLVIDTDLRSSVMSLLLNATPPGNIQGMLNAIIDLDQFRWRDSVLPAFGVDFLLSNRSLETPPPGWAEYYQLFNFARERYDTILVDLPELINPATIELVRRSARVFPVCTSELPSLRLAQQRCEELDRWGVPAERVAVVLNRWHRADLAPAEIAKILNRPIRQSLPNDYPTVAAAQRQGMAVPAGSKLGRAYSELAASLLPTDAVSRPAPRLSKFMSMFGR